MYKKHVILHISDLHFSATCDKQAQANRDLLFDGLLTRLKSIEVDWRPTLVCVTGDITDKGNPKGFNDAADWLKRLANELKIDIERFFLSPGNHDCVRDKQICPPLVPSTPEEADALLNCDTPQYLQARFNGFSDFCKTLGIPPYKLGDKESYLVGGREIDSIQFIACNTSWFSWDQNEQSRLWLGLDILRYLENKKQLVGEGTDVGEKLSIALMHHGTEKYFQGPETEHRGNRPPALHYLWKRCHLALYGHSHESATGDPHQMSAHCWIARAGAVNAGANYPNNVNLIRLSQEGFELRTLEYNPADAGSPWDKSSTAKLYTWANTAEPKEESKNSNENLLPKTPLNILRERAVNYAAEVIINKSRQIKPHGNLPEQISLRVALKPESESNIDPFASDSTLEKSKLSCLPIDEAVFRSRLTLLFGDLGSGKSTLLAKLAKIIDDHVPNCLQFFIPASLLKVEDVDGAGKLIELINGFIANDLNAGDYWSFKRIIDDGYELFLLVDGLDEVDKKSAIHLTRLLANLPEVYSNITVVLSSRFSEMVGVNFERWQVCQVLPVDSDQKEELFKNEALSQGSKESDAVPIASRVKSMLENNPPLNAIANSPLAVRLLYPSLITETASLRERTLGDLLHDLLLQRLGEWAEKDLKATPLSEFEDVFPCPENRASLLGELAFQVLDSGNLSRVEATAIIKRYVPESKRLLADLIAKQFLSFLEDAGIIAGMEQINFIYQPLTQIAAGVYLAENLVQHATIETPKIEIWRVVSFAGTMARRMGRQKDMRDWFFGCIDSWMGARWGITPSCYVCDELRDENLAQRLIDLLPRLKRRPLWFLEEERAASTQAIASTLVLAGEKGFDWLYSEYLDPRIPATNSGSALIQSLFGKWALLIKPQLTPIQHQRLAKLVPPLLAISPLGTHGFLDNLAYLVPEEFEQTHYLWLTAGQLDSRELTQWAKEQLVNASGSGNHDLVNKILERKPGKVGAFLWLELNQDKEPPASILRAVLSAKWTSQSDPNRFNTVLAKCRERIGKDRGLAFLRWCLTDPDSGVAAAAALELMEQGEESFYLIGDALSNVLDTGGLGNKAEIAMRKLISLAQQTEINWVSCLFGKRDRSMGARAGSWRILLELLNKGMDNGPDLLISCIDAIGPYNLPRYPDIRLAFRTLLTGPNRQDYRNALRATLNHYDPSVRHAAAMALTASCPGEEGLALVTAISFVGNHSLSDYWEWEKFLVTLNFGPSVLETLRSSLSTLNPKARNMGLVLLIRNGILLSEVDKLALLCTKDWQIRHVFDALDSSDFGLRSEYAYNLMRKELENRPLTDCEHIAEDLQKYHGEKLSFPQRAKCLAATLKSRFGFTLSLDELIDQLNKDSQLRDEIKHLRNVTGLQGFPKLLHHMIGPDGELNISWDELLWDVFCSDHKLTSHREDDIGLELLWLGQKLPEYGKRIGEATAILLDDERIQKQRWTNHYHWLAVLADEFIGLEKDKLEAISCVVGSLAGSATCSLLKRIGKIPTGFTTRDRYNSLPKDLLKSGEAAEQNSTVLLHDELLDAARESEWLKPNIENLITRSLLEVEISQEFLDELAAKGNNGCLMAGVFAFCCCLDIKAKYALSFISHYEPPDRQNSAILSRLKSVAMLSHYALTRLNSSAKGEYVSALLQAIGQEEYSWEHYLYELLRVEKGLTLEQIGLLLPRFAQDEFNGGLNRAIVHFLSEWVRDLSDTTLREKLLQICPSCMETLDMASWEADSLNTRSPSLLLFFSLLYWAVGGEPDEKSRRVFARGIKLMFHHRTYSNLPAKPQQYEIMQSVNPLLSCVPHHVLRNALEGLMDFPETEVRIWVRFFNCFQS